CSTAHDTVIDEDNALSFKHGTVTIMFELYAKMANLIGWFDKGTSDIMVADDTKLERNAGFFSVAECARNPRIGNRYHYVGFDSSFARQLCTNALAGFIHVTAFGK